MEREKKLLKPAALAFGTIIVTLIGLRLFGLRLPPFSTSDESKVVEVHYVDNISAAHQRAIDLFNSRNKGRIEVVPVNLPFEKFTTNERKELLARSMRSKSDQIDIFAVDQIWVPRFAKWGEPLDRYVTEKERQTFVKYALETCTRDSVLVSLPLYIDIGMMYYRHDLLQSAPHAKGLEEKLRNSMTWEEFIQLRDRLHQMNKPFYVFQASDYEGLTCNFFELLAGRDERFLLNHEINLNSSVARSTLQFMVDLVNKQHLSPKSVTDFDEQRSYAFTLEEDAVFLRGWPGFVEQFRRTYRDPSKLNNIGQAALPHFKGKKPVSVFGGWNLMISKYSLNKLAALEFVRFLQTKEIQKLLFEVGGFIPVKNSVYGDTTYLRQRVDLAYYRKLLDRGFHRPALEEYTKMSDIISHYVRLAIKEEMTVSEALEQASRKIQSNEILIKR
jgi:multiple sugar transport system substrate-binding protein